MSESSNEHHPSDDELLASAQPIEPDNAEAEDEAIELEEADGPAEAAGARSAKIQIQGVRESAPHEEYWNRTPNTTGHGAIHCKTFIAKLRLDAVEHMDRQINEWLDAHPQYEVKFVTTNIGPLKGKTTEDALFITVWV